MPEPLTPDSSRSEFIRGVLLVAAFAAGHIFLSLLLQRFPIDIVTDRSTNRIRDFGALLLVAFPAVALIYGIPILLVVRGRVRRGAVAALGVLVLLGCAALALLVSTAHFHL